MTRALLLALLAACAAGCAERAKPALFVVTGEQMLRLGELESENRALRDSLAACRWAVRNMAMLDSCGVSYDVDDVSVSLKEVRTGKGGRYKSVLVILPRTVTQ